MRFKCFLLVAIAALLLPLLTSAQTPGFDPVISQIGFLRPDNTLEWVITVDNPGAAAGLNVRVVDTLDEALRLDRVQIASGTVSISGQVVEVFIPVMNPGDTVQFSILTSRIGEASVSNTACVRADNLANQRCTTVLPVSSLPATGELPQWRDTLLMLGAFTLSIAVFMFGIALAGLRWVSD